TRTSRKFFRKTRIGPENPRQPAGRNGCRILVWKTRRWSSYLLKERRMRSGQGWSETRLDNCGFLW
ncbi:MAG: hypothetical protein WD989_01695, partial [Candidatus Paceibacterota bacterium]